MKFFTKKRIIILILIILAMAGFLFFRQRNNSQTEIFTVTKGTVKEELVLSGTVKAEKHVVMTFPVSGKISRVGVSQGQEVYKGQPLVSLDRIVLNAAYQQALNNYRNYQAQADAALDSLKDNDSDETFAEKAARTQAEVARDNAYDAMVAAKYNLDNATLYAPFAGTVSSLLYSFPGVNITPADRIAEVIDLSTIYFEVEADQTDVLLIKEDSVVSIVLDSMGDSELIGEVSLISVTPKPNSLETVYSIRIELNGVGQQNIPRVGMTGDAHFVLSEKSDVLYAPLQFINSDREGDYVNLGKQGNKVYVETGIQGEENIEIVKGVKEGDILYD
jgi:RND family efflux transporter MFP subunit